MQPITHSIFNSEYMNEKIDEIHEGFTSAAEKYKYATATSTLTLLDFLSDPNTNFREGYRHQDAARGLLREGDEAPIWSHYGFKAHIETSVMTARYNFVQRLSEAEKELIQSEKSVPDKLASLSYKAKTGGTALAFKVCHISRWGHKPYEGMLASTGPVRVALKELFGMGKETQLRYSLFQHKLAHELGMEPNRLNTALWILGRQFEAVDQSE